MKIACFDLKGTIVDHMNETRQIPLVGELLRALNRNGWKLFLLSSYQTAVARRILQGAGVTEELVLLSSSGEGNKGRVLMKAIEGEEAEEVIFIDDKPENLAAVKQELGGRVRVLGFTGSLKYAPRVSSWCMQHDVELALSAIDLCETIGVYMESRMVSSMDIEELAALIPGLDHPMSSTAGETGCFDHRSILAEVFKKASGEMTAIARRLGWITCNECLLKALVRTVIVTLGLDAKEVLAGAYKCHEYVKALEQYRPDTSFKKALKVAICLMRDGIEEIGPDAEKCRPRGRHIELNRISLATQMLSTVFKL